MDDAGNGGPVSLHNVVSSVHHALVALLDEEDPCANIQSHAHHRPHRRVHALECEVLQSELEVQGLRHVTGIKCEWVITRTENDTENEVK